MVCLKGNAAIGTNALGKAVCRVELHAGHVGEHQHDAPRRLVVNFRRLLPARLPSQDKIVIVAVALAQERVVGPNILSDRFCLAEIRRGTGYRDQFAGRNQALARSGHKICVDLQFMGKDIPSRIARQIKEAVIGQIYKCGYIGFRCIVDHQGVVRRQGVADGDVEIPREALLAVRTAIGKGDRRRFVVVVAAFQPPSLLMEALETAVQSVAIFVLA